MRHRRQWGIGKDEIVVGTIARLFENKGYEEIIEAMPAAVAEEPKLRFVWIGGGNRRAQYEEQLTRLGLRDRVHFVGLIDPDAVAAHVNAFDIVLHASRWEGLPRALVQGLLTEIPAVSYDNDGAREVVIPGETGILVPYGDTAGLADALAALAPEASRRRALGKAGRALCLERFNWRTMVEQLEAVYKEQ